MVEQMATRMKTWALALASILLAVPAGANAASDSGVPAEWRQRWGFYLDMLGQPYVVIDQSKPPVDANLRSTLSWSIPGETMLSTTTRADTGEVLFSQEIRWDEGSHSLVSGAPGSQVLGHQRVQADGSMVVEVDTGGSPAYRLRITSRMLPDRSVESVLEEESGATGKSVTHTTSAPATAANVAIANQLKQKLELAGTADVRRKGLETAEQLRKSSGATPAEEATYGVLARLAGSAWAFPRIPSKYGDMQPTTRFSWLPGRSGILVEDSSPGAAGTWTVRPGPTPGQLTMDGGIAGFQTDHYILRLVDADTAVADWSKMYGNNFTRIVISSLPDGSLYFLQELGERGKLPPVPTLAERSAMIGKSQVDFAVVDATFDANKRAGEKIIGEFNKKQAAEARAKLQASLDRWNKVLGAMYTGLQAANSAYDAASQASLDESLAEPEGATAEAHSVPHASDPARGAARPNGDAGTRNAGAGQPLRFVLDIGLLNKPGDTVNPTCYSNVITRPGPPGWKGEGFLPDGSEAQARETVESMKSSFIAACRATGRDISSEGNFHWTWNETRDGDQQVDNAHARASEDVTVSLD
jgi:hypothetical protein